MPGNQKPTGALEESLRPILEEASQLLFKKLCADFGDRKWVKAYYDFRYSTLNSGCGEYGVKLADDSENFEFRVPRQVPWLMVRMQGILREYEDQAFYGITFILTPDGAVETRYSFDKERAALMVDRREIW